MLLFYGQNAVACNMPFLAEKPYQPPVFGKLVRSPGKAFFYLIFLLSFVLLQAP